MPHRNQGSANERVIGIPKLSEGTIGLSTQKRTKKYPIKKYLPVPAGKGRHDSLIRAGVFSIRKSKRRFKKQTDFYRACANLIQKEFGVTVSSAALGNRYLFLNKEGYLIQEPRVQTRKRSAQAPDEVRFTQQELRIFGQSKFRGLGNKELIRQYRNALRKPTKESEQVKTEILLAFRHHARGTSKTIEWFMNKVTKK